MMNKQVLSLLLIQLITPGLVLAGNRPGSGGGCDGEAPRPRPNFGANLGAGGANPGAGGANPNGGGPPNRRFLRDIANPAAKRFLQGGNGPGDSGGPFEVLTDEDIALCCTGNGDFDFLMRDLDINPGGLAEATEAEGFRQIPGDSLWSCRRECRNPLNAYDEDRCSASCDCRQGCPTAIDFLTADCREKCTFPIESVEQELCLELCDEQCGERCRSTLNGYIVPLDIYAEGLEILDCRYGDLIGDSEGSCNVGQAYWESQGYNCQIVEGGNFDCECINPGTCINDVYPCDYEFYCVSNSPSLIPSSAPSSVPSTLPSVSPSKSPTRSPTPRPTRGKAGMFPKPEKPPKPGKPEKPPKKEKKKKDRE